MADATPPLPPKAGSPPRAGNSLTPGEPVAPKPAATFVAKADRICQKEEAVICERCGAEMFRMHAVWRCPKCRFKTDCCGW